MTVPLISVRSPKVGRSSCNVRHDSASSNFNVRFFYHFRHNLNWYTIGIFALISDVTVTVTIARPVKWANTFSAILLV